MPNHLTSRERIRTAIQHRQPDRLPMIETLFWPQTIKRWQTEGLPEGVDLVEYFQLDRLEHFFDFFDSTLQVEPRILEETDDSTIRITPYGAIFKEPKQEFAPKHMIEPAIKDRADWERVRVRLKVSESRFTQPEIIDRIARLQAQGVFVTIETIEPLWFVLHNTMGFEHGLLMLANAPDLIEEMIDTYASFAVGMLELCFQKGVRADALWLYSDLCYKNGMLFSPRAFRELATPHLKRFSEFCRRHGLSFWWHSDGDVSQLIPLLIELGVDAIHPLEVRAGNDARRLKKQYGESITLVGNIDADVVAAGDKTAIEMEVAGKIPVAADGGGYIYHMDHSVPPTLSLESYQFLLETVRCYGALDACIRI